MKKIAKLFLLAAVAAFALVSCKGKDNPVKPDDKQENPSGGDQNGGGEKQEEEIKLAIDGKFGEWDAIAPVEGENVILLTKTQTDENKLYFYIEADAEEMETDNIAYANYLHLYFDCGGDGAESVSYWGGETGSTYDIMYEIWLMTGGNATISQWYSGVVARAKISDGVYRAEISIERSSNELFASKIIYYGAALTDTYVDTSEGGETWLGGDLIGLCPAQGEDMAKFK